MTDEIRTIPPKLTKTEWNALLDHALIVPASYIIYKVDTEYKAKNGLTGKIDYSGTDATTVIQAAINATNSGEVRIKGEIPLNATVNMKTKVIVHFDKIIINTDIDGFLFNAVENSELYGNEVKVTTAAYSKAVIKLQGNAVDENKVVIGKVTLPFGYGYAVYFIADNEEYGYGNELAIRWIQYGKQGYRLETVSGSGNININKFGPSTIWRPSECGIMLLNNGLDISGNKFDNIQVELGDTDHDAIRMGGTGTGSISNNYFFSCAGIDIMTGCYYLRKIAGTTTVITLNIHIGSQGSAFLPNASDFVRDIFIDYSYWTTQLHYGDSTPIMIQRWKPTKSNTNILFGLGSNRDPDVSTRAAIEIDNTKVMTKEYMELGAYGTYFSLRLVKAAGYVLRPFIFKIIDEGIITEVARIDTDKNFKFSTFTFPLSTPANPVEGSAYFNIATNRLYIYNGTAWVSTLLS